VSDVETTTRQRDNSSFRDLSDILKLWSGLGRAAREGDYSCTWAGALRIVNAAEPWFKVCREELKGLLIQSDTRLAPLGEPLLLDFGVHRWLRREREESYSDWLAWIIDQLPSADHVFQLLGITCPAEYQNCSASTCREKLILDNKRKLDLVVALDKKPRIVVEIKKNAAEDESTKLKDYRKWAIDNDVPYLILLGTATESTDDLAGFQIRQWDEVCVVLRKCSGEIREKQGKKGLLVAAMALAFVGAVEQNLLRFSAPTKGLFSRDWPRIAEHIRRSVTTQGEQS
jgi:hypothetical protein